MTCDRKHAPGIGAVGAAAARRAQAKHDQQIREQTIRELTGLQAPPQLTSTQYAQRVLCVVGGIVLLASVDLVVHIVVITVLVAVILALVGGVGVLAYRLGRRNRRTPVLPAPDPELAAVKRITVTAATVRPIGRAPEREMKPLKARSQRIG